jgi:hypothetical protein
VLKVAEMAVEEERDRSRSFRDCYVSAPAPTKADWRSGDKQGWPSAEQLNVSRLRPDQLQHRTSQHRNFAACKRSSDERQEIRYDPV